MKGGTCTYAIQKACHAPIRRPIRSIIIDAAQGFIPLLSINVAPTAPAKQTTEPTERSMLPPVKIHNNIPVARTNTYAFWEIKLLTFCGRRILPPVCHVKNNVTNTKTIIIVYFLTPFINFALSIVYAPLFEDFKICDIMISCDASSPCSSPTILPSFMI